MQSADWQSLWQGWGISGDLNLGLWGLCVALHSCKPKLQLRTYLTADRCAGLWMALDGCSSCFMEDVPGCCNQMQPTEALATAVSFLNPLLWSLMQDSRSQVALVPTCFLARILPAFADCPDTVARMTNSKHNLTSRQQITEKGGLKAPKELLAVSIVLAVSALLACGFAGMMYAKEKAGQPMFMKIEDQEPDSKA